MPQRIFGGATVQQATHFDLMQWSELAKCGGLTAFNPVAGTAYWTPFIARYKIRVSHIGFLLTAQPAAQSRVMLGIYDHQAASGGSPNNLLLATALTDLNGTANLPRRYEIAVTTTTIFPKTIYWLAFMGHNADAASTVMQHADTVIGRCMSYPEWDTAGAYVTLPNPAPAMTVPIDWANAPIMYLRATGVP